MKNKIAVFVFLLCGISSTVFGQFYDYDAPEIKLKSGLPSVFAVESVRQLTEGDQESVLNISVTVKKGKIESVSRDGGMLGRYHKNKQQRSFNVFDKGQSIQDCRRRIEKGHR